MASGLYSPWRPVYAGLKQPARKQPWTLFFTNPLLRNPLPRGPRCPRPPPSVVTLAILLGVVTYLQRACLGSLEKPLIHDLHTTEQGLAWVHFAFALSYAAFGIASARWADRAGTRVMLTAVVAAWSLCTFATGLAQTLTSLIVIRLLFGVGESGAWPAITQTLSRWIPYRERGTAQGVVWIGAHITVGITPLLVGQLMEGVSWHGLYLPPMSWREVLMLFSFSGIIWAAAWYWWFRDEPEQHRQVHAAEAGVYRRTAAPP